MISSTGSANRVSSCRAENALSFRRLVVALRVQQVKLGLRGVQLDQAKPHVTVLGTVANGLS